MSGWPEPERRASVQYDTLLVAALGIVVNSDVDLLELNATGGRVDFLGARLGGAVDASRARLDNAVGYTLSLHHSAVLHLRPQQHADECRSGNRRRSGQPGNHHLP